MCEQDRKMFVDADDVGLPYVRFIIAGEDIEDVGLWVSEDYVRQLVEYLETYLEARAEV